MLGLGPCLAHTYLRVGVARVRELVRRRAFLVRIRTRVKNRIIATLVLEWGRST
ncbi:hypothetical protein HRbin02_00176 [Candidatus Calditenuaceae archaeon HR02]|nr:hypothetical protein HRbin02_00176 [Candidatus Calditenuaceae archaeon HR02]